MFALNELITPTDKVGVPAFVILIVFAIVPIIKGIYHFCYHRPIRPNKKQLTLQKIDDYLANINFSKKQRHYLKQQQKRLAFSDLTGLDVDDRRANLFLSIINDHNSNITMTDCIAINHHLNYKNNRFVFDVSKIDWVFLNLIKHMLFIILFFIVILITVTLLLVHFFIKYPYLIKHFIIYYLSLFLSLSLYAKEYRIVKAVDRFYTYKPQLFTNQKLSLKQEFLWSFGLIVLLMVLIKFQFYLSGLLN